MKTVLIFISVLLLASAPVHALEPQAKDFLASAEIQIDGKHALYEITLGEEVYKIIQRMDFADFRAYNAQGEMLPMRLQTPAPCWIKSQINDKSGMISAPLVLNSEDKVFLAASTPGIFPVCRVRINTPSGSGLKARLESAGEGEKYWTFHSSEWFYDLNNGKKDLQNAAIDITMTPHKHWRLMTLSPISVDAVKDARIEWSFVPHTILVLPQGLGPYRLVFGHPQAEPVASSIDQLKSQINDGGKAVGLATLSAITKQNDKPIEVTDPTIALQRARDQKRIYIFWGIIGVGLILLATLSWSLLKELKKTK